MYNAKQSKIFVGSCLYCKFLLHWYLSSLRILKKPFQNWEKYELFCVHLLFFHTNGIFHMLIYPRFVFISKLKLYFVYNNVVKI